MTDRINHNVAAAMNALYEHQGDPPEIAACAWTSTNCACAWTTWPRRWPRW